MTDQEGINEEVLFTEAPASWNTRYKTPSGFICQLTLRDEVGTRLLEKTQAAMQVLLESGCLPYPANNNSSNGNKDPKAWCQIHQCEMKRWERDGKVWHSHQTTEGWCYGRGAKSEEPN